MLQNETEEKLTTSNNDVVNRFQEIAKHEKLMKEVSFLVSYNVPSMGSPKFHAQGVIS